MERPNEQNRGALLEAIRKLPVYEAPPQLWPEIQVRLDEKAALQAAVGELPQYPAPMTVWPRIEQALNEQPQVPAGIRRLSRSVVRLAAAAIVGLVALALWWSSTGPRETITLAYTEAVVSAPDVVQDWDTEDEDFRLVLKQVDRSPVAEPAIVERLKLELDELTEARNEVAIMLQRYGKDDQLLKEAARIERVRSRVLKELAVWI